MINFLRGGGKDVSSDKNFIKSWNEQFNNNFLSKKDITRYIAGKSISNVELVEGDILETLDAYIKENPRLRIALLHIDTDVYAPAIIGLEKLFDRVVRGGVIVFDDYACVEGETLAVEEFFADKPEYVLKKFTFSHRKPSFVVKK